MDAMELLEGRRSGALDPDVEEEYARILIDLGWAARSQDRDDEALVWFQRAEEALEDLAHEPLKLLVIISIDNVRREIARLFGRRGQDESRRRLLESHIRMLERLSERVGADPAIGLMAALAQAIVAPDQSASARSAPRWRDFRQIHGSRDGWKTDWRRGLPATSSRIRPT